MGGGDHNRKEKRRRVMVKREFGQKKASGTVQGRGLTRLGRDLSWELKKILKGEKCFETRIPYSLAKMKMGSHKNLMENQIGEERASLAWGEETKVKRMFERVTDLRRTTSLVGHSWTPFWGPNLGLIRGMVQGAVKRGKTPT